MEAELGRGAATVSLKQWFHRYGTIVFLLLMVAFFASQNDHFLSARNLTNILAEVSIYGIIAVGMTFVIVTAGVDLSVGSLLAFAGMVGAYLAQASGLSGGSEALIALGGAVVIGGLAGLLHGGAVTAFAIPPFIVTLGGLTIWRGATLMLNDGAPISGFGATYLWWGSGVILGVPVPVAVFAAVAAIAIVVERYTRYGRQIYAVGGNAEAARLSGINVNLVLTSVYIIVGLLSGLAGFLLSARLGSSEAVAGVGYELRVIASVVIGGTSLMGGRGKISGTLVGALLIGVLTNGLVIMHVSAYLQQIAIGLIILAAVAFDTYARRR